MSNPVTVTQRHEFSCGYVMNKELNCKRYRIEATVGLTQEAENNGSCLILDFGKFKQYLRSIVPDKTFLINTTEYCDKAVNAWDNLQEGFTQLGCNVQFVTYPICTETLCQDLAERLMKELPDDVLLLKVTLYEDSYSYSTWVAEHT